MYCIIYYNFALYIFKFTYLHTYISRIRKTENSKICNIAYMCGSVYMLILICVYYHFCIYTHSICMYYTYMHHLYHMFNYVSKCLSLLILHYIRNEINHWFYIFLLSIIFIHPFNLIHKMYHSDKNVNKIVYTFRLSSIEVGRTEFQ